MLRPYSQTTNCDLQMSTHPSRRGVERVLMRQLPGLGNTLNTRRSSGDDTTRRDTVRGPAPPVARPAHRTGELAALPRGGPCRVNATRVRERRGPPRVSAPPRAVYRRDGAPRIRR